MNVHQMLAYETIRTVFGPWLNFTFRISSEGADNVPGDGGGLLVCNHRSILDPLALMTEVDRYIHFVAGSRGFVIPMIKTFYRMTGMVRLSLKGGSGDTGFEEAVRLLKDGEIVGIFPEGIESLERPDGVGRTGYFRTGVARIALEARVPVIPAAVIPGEEVTLRAVPGRRPSARTERSSARDGPPGFVLYRRVLVRIGRPIDLSGFKDVPVTKAAIDTLSGKIRRVVMKLYGGEDLERLMTGELPFDIYTDRV